MDKDEFKSLYKMKFKSGSNYHLNSPLLFVIRNNYIVDNIYTATLHLCGNMAIGQAIHLEEIRLYGKYRKIRIEKNKSLHTSTLGDLDDCYIYQPFDQELKINLDYFGLTEIFSLQIIYTLEPYGNKMVATIDGKCKKIISETGKLFGYALENVRGDFFPLPRFGIRMKRLFRKEKDIDCPIIIFQNNDVGNRMSDMLPSYVGAEKNQPIYSYSEDYP